MKKTLLFSIVYFLFSTITEAQMKAPVNSGEVIPNAVKLHDQGKYKEAIELLRQVPRNDTSYALAQYELAYSYTADSNFKEAFRSIDEGLLENNENYELDFLLLKASLTDDMGDSKKAIQMYDSILLKYPNAQGIMLNKAISYMRLKDYDQAETILEKLLIMNPYYASAHYRLGIVELAKGQIVPAMMCFYTYLINNPTGPFNKTVVKLLSNFSSGTDDVHELIAKRTVQPEGNFAMVEEIVLSKIALDKNYKVLTGLDDPIIRQLQVMMEKLEYDSESTDFFMQFYTPYLKDIFEKKQFEPAVYQAFSGLDIEAIQRYVKKNQKEIEQADVIIAGDLQTLRTTRELNFAKRQTLAPIYHYSDGYLYGKGNIVQGNTDGLWIFYHKNGNVNSTGQFVNGKKEGKWTYYYKNGNLAGYENFKEGEKEGEDLTYNTQGVLISKANYSKGKLNGEKIKYFALGHVFNTTWYVDDKESGKYVEYFSSGRKKVEANALNDNLQGAYISYHENGKQQVVSSYDNGKANGPYKSYYDNGQLEFSCIYKNGDIDGEALTYHPSGQLMKKTQYVNGQIDGEEIQYNESGVVAQKVLYKKGKAEGLAQYFGDDGKLYSTFLFSGDKLKEAKYYDKSGKEISSSVRQNKQIALTVYNEEGFKVSTSTYTDQGDKVNADNFYYNSGQIKEENTYVDGLLENVTTGYFQNGKKQYEVRYEKDKKNGLTRDYYADGSLQSEGWYIDGELNGDWINYSEKGIVTMRRTYLNDILYGTRQSYFENGKLDDEEVYKNGWLTALYQYDTTGRLLFTSKLVNGSGKYKGIYMNGKTRFEGNFDHGEFDGPYNNYYFDGSPKMSEKYEHGLLNGKYITYYYGGMVSLEGNYELGKKTGVWKSYLENGKISREEKYLNGELDGLSTYYFPNGKVEREINFRHDVRNGIYKRYTEDGQLSIIMMYKDDVAVSYSYNDASGKPVADIPLPGGNGSVVSYFSNGKKSAEFSFTDGKLSGPYKLYQPDGKTYYEEENDICGLTEGHLTEYYPNGKIMLSYTDHLDNIEGPYKEYYENGQIKIEGNYFNGVSNGTWNYYTETGKLKEKRFFYYGVLLNVTK